MVKINPNSRAASGRRRRPAPANVPHGAPQEDPEVRGCMDSTGERELELGEGHDSSSQVPGLPLIRVEVLQERRVAFELFPGGLEQRGRASAWGSGPRRVRGEHQPAKIRIAVSGEVLPEGAHAVGRHPAAPDEDLGLGTLGADGNP